MDQANSVATPLDGKEMFALVSADEPRTNQLKYQRQEESIMYAMTSTRLNLTYAVGKLSQHAHDQTARHQTALDQVLKYLKRTADLALVYDHKSSGNLIGYADAA